MIRHVGRGASQEPGFEVSGEVLLLINNCLNEVLHGFRTPNLEAALGTPVRQAEDLLNRVNRDASDTGGAVAFQARDLALIVKCIRLTLSELGPEFSIRTGFQNEAARSCQEEIAAAIARNPKD